MIIIPPAASAASKIWRAKLQAQDLPTAQLMGQQVAKWNLELPEGWDGTNESPYLAAACGSTLATVLNILSKKEASRLSASALSEEGMRTAALMELHNAGSFFDWGAMQHDFEIAAGLLDQLDLDYLALHYTQLTETRQARRWIARVAAADLSAGGSGLIPAENVPQIENLISRFRFQSPNWDSSEQKTMLLLLTEFNAAELALLLRELAVTDDELHAISRLRGELGGEHSIDQLIEEVRSMNSRWLKALLD